jgi:hypothetical protein
MLFTSRYVSWGLHRTLGLPTLLTEFLLIPTSALILLTHVSLSLKFAFFLLSLKFL